MRLLKISYLYLVILLVLTVCFTGCGSNENVGNKNILYSVTDSQGYKIDFKAKPTRIVSLSISTDEILLDLLPTKDIIAITKYSDDPGISNVIDKAKNVKNRVDGSNAEYILSLNPDLVIIPDFVKPEMIKSLREFGINVYVYKTPSTINEVKDNIRELAKVVGEPSKADKLIDYMDERLNKVNNALGKIPLNEQKRVGFMRDNGIYYSPNSSFRDICKYANVYDVTNDIKEDKNFNLSMEQVVKLNPDIFVISDWDYDGKHSKNSQVENIMSNKAYENITAWKKKNFIVIPAAKLLSLSPYIADAVLLMAEKAYPDKFKN